MRLKKVLKISLIALGSTFLIAFLAFITFVYSPFEGRVAELRGAIPRTIDFYIGKKKLSDDFVQFPEPNFWADLLNSDSFPALRQTQFYRQNIDNAENRRSLLQLEALQEQLSLVPLLTPDILSDFIGEEVIVAGRYGTSLRDVEWCAYTRVSWKLRAAISCLAYSWARSMAEGVSIRVEGEFFVIESPGRPTNYLTRIKDLAMLSNSKDLLQTSIRLANGEKGPGLESLEVSADYQDLLLKKRREWMERNEGQSNFIDFSLNLETLGRLMPAFVNWPGEGMEIGIEGRIFKAFVNLQAMRKLWGSIVFHDSIVEPYFEGKALSAILRVDLNGNSLSDPQKRFLDQSRGDTERWLKRLLFNVPAKAAMTFILRVPPTILFEEVVGSLDRDTKELINSAFRSAGQSGGLRAWAKKLAPAFRPYSVLIIRNNQYRRFAKEYEVKIKSPAPVWAVMFKVIPTERWRLDKELEDFEKGGWRKYGFKEAWHQLAGKNNEERFMEFVHSESPGTGHYAYLNGSRELDNIFICSNSGKLVREIINAKWQLEGVKSILTNPLLNENLDQLPESLSGFVWIQGAEVRAILRKYQQFAKGLEASGGYSAAWAVGRRPSLERELFRREGFDRRAASLRQLLAKDRRALDAIVDKELDRLWEVVRLNRAREGERAYRELMAMLGSLEAASIYLATSSKDLYLELRCYLGF